MVLPLTIAVPTIDPDAPDPAFVVDRERFRVTVAAWAHPEPVGADGLCTASLVVGPTAARLDAADCAEPLRGALERAAAAWAVEVTSAPSAEVEVLRLAWSFEGDDPPMAFAAPVGGLGFRAPTEFVVPLREHPGGVWSGCVECRRYHCRIELAIDERGRAVAGEVTAEPFERGCPPPAHEDARRAAVAQEPGYVFGPEGWPVAWRKSVSVQLEPRAVRRVADPIEIELRGEFAVEPGE